MPLLSNESREKLRAQAKLDLARAEQEQARTRDEWFQKRAELRARAENDPEAQAAIKAICAAPPSLNPLRGIFFFIYYFIYTYNPRARKKWVPFILFPYQIMVIWWLYNSIEETLDSEIDKRNLLIEKARDMGVSWLVCAFMLWYLLFRNADFLIGSRKAEEVDKKGDRSTPFQKIRDMFYLLPDWMQPQGFDSRVHDKERLFINPEGGQIEGESSNTEFGRGGRYTMILMDEIQDWEYGEQAYGSCSESTNVRLTVGTSAGMDNFLYELREQKHGEVDVKTLHWRLHPVKGAGQHLDENNKWTSPWYETRVKKYSSEVVAQEIDIQYDKSAGGIYFKTYVPDKHGQPKVLAMPRGDIVRAWDPGQKHFFVLWVQFDEFGRVLILRELHVKDARLREVARAVNEISKALEDEYPYYRFRYDDVGDPQGATRTGAGVDLPDYETLREEFDLFIDYEFILDIRTPQRESSRHTAIKNCLDEFVATAPGLGTEKGTMKLLVDTNHCPETHKALSSGYRYKVGKDGKPLPGEQIAESRPANDAIDCLGYAILRKWGVIESRNREEEFEVDDESYEWKGLRRRGAA